MKASEKRKLIAGAYRLFLSGLRLERARRRVKHLHLRGVTAAEANMRRALKNFQKCENEWVSLEKKHIALRNDMLYQF